MPRINSALFKFKPGTRDKMKCQTTFDFEPLEIWVDEPDTSKWEGVSKYVPMVHPDQANLAQEIMEGNLTTTKWADEEATEFDFGGTP